MPILRTILHITALVTIYTAITGCSRHTEVIILKKPNTLAYYEVMEGLK